MLVVERKVVCFSRDMHQRRSVVLRGVEDEFNSIDSDLDGVIDRKEMSNYALRHHLDLDIVDVSPVSASPEPSFD